MKSKKRLSVDENLIVEVTETNFEKEVLMSKGPVLLIFGGLWSIPCQQIKDSLLEEILRTCEGKVKIGLVDVDCNPGLCIWYEVVSVPTFLGFIGGEVIERIVGISAKQDFLLKIKRHFLAVKNRINR